MTFTIRPEDLMAEASNLSPVISAAQHVVAENSRNIDADGATSLANVLIEAARNAQRTLADVSKYPAGRRAAADEILAKAERQYAEWRDNIEVHEAVFLAELHGELFKTPTGSSAIIARADAEQLLRRRDIPLSEIFKAMAGAGGDLAQLAASPWLEIVAMGRNADAKALRLLVENVLVQDAAQAGNRDARKLLDGPAAYAKVRVALAKIAAECLGVNKSAFAERALAWGQP
ncbi:hypothetical protein ACJWDR_29225 [Streptomyces tauricus]|uniref:hypothetical protein n=1 Tax=Streptomyces tauricus TaxID=68274 RepID=UPI00387F1D21